MSEDLVLKLQRQIAASPDVVFDAWTDASKMAQWFGPESVMISDCSAELNIGGTWHAVMETDNGTTHICSGIYREIERPSRIVFTWAWTQDDGSRGNESIITILFEAKNGGTLLSLEQISFASQDAMASHESGWLSTFDSLEKFVAKHAAAAVG